MFFKAKKILIIWLENWIRAFIQKNLEINKTSSLLKQEISRIYPNMPSRSRKKSSFNKQKIKKSINLLQLTISIILIYKRSLIKETKTLNYLSSLRVQLIRAGAKQSRRFKAIFKEKALGQIKEVQRKNWHLID